ncbi:MAG: response regulator transcription factor [Actinomycetota bacterium]
MRGPIEAAVADVLDQHDVDVARARLAAAILAATDTEIAARVSVRRGRPEALVRIHGRGLGHASEHLPSAAAVRQHPLYRYRAQTGDRRPTTLEDVVRAGWPLGAATQRCFETARISEHQADFVVPSGEDYDGWALIAPDRISRAQLRPLNEHARLLRGLDSHVEILARIRAQAWLEPDAAHAILTPRELTVLQLMHAGRTAASIGVQLGVSPRTVHKHQEHLYRKLGASDRLGAVLAAQRTGLLPAGPAWQEAAAAVVRDRARA